MPAIETKYFSIDLEGSSSCAERAEVMKELAQILYAGGIVAFPTETVYGLGVIADNKEAVGRLYELKDRPDGLPLTYHLADAEKVLDHVTEVPKLARILMERYWPGPLTLVMPVSNQKTVGIRVPSHELARELLRQVGNLVVATSANPHGEEPAVNVNQVREYFDGRVDAVLEGGQATLRQASAVVSVNKDSYKVIREGIITHEMVHQLLVGKNILFVCTGNSCRSPMAAAIFGKLLSEKLGSSVDDLRELGYIIHSAGIFATHGGMASEHAVEMMESLGCELRNHRTRPLTAEMILEADHIYALSSSHLYQVLQFDKSAEGRTSMLSETGIIDPIGGDLETYRNCAESIEEALRKLLKNF